MKSLVKQVTLLRSEKKGFKDIQTDNVRVAVYSIEI